MNRPVEEIAEIERHKYFLSEKHGQDVGWDFAAQDWEANFAAKWRADQGSHDSGQPVAVARAVDVKTGDAAAEPIRHVDPGACGTTGRSSGPLMRLFSRLFAKTS